MNHSTKKYRPVLPAYLIAHMIDIAKTEVPLSKESVELIGVLAPFMAKIENLAKAPVYTTTPPVDKKLEQFQSLGGTVVDASLPKEVYWEECYIKCKDSWGECTLNEIDAANEWRYLKNLMSPEEIKAFEAGTKLVQEQAE